MITFITIPKPFNSKFKIIQTNAILSWLNLNPKPEIFLFGDKVEIGPIKNKWNLKTVSITERNEFGTPLVSDVFNKSSNISENKYICFLNADIIVDPNLSKVFEIISKHFDKFLIISRRWNVKINKPINFKNVNWFNQIASNAHKRGKIYSIMGIDLFIFPKGLYDNIPNFAIGRTVMDNWMLYYAKSKNIPIIDITDVSTMVHQNHHIKRNLKDNSTNHTGIESKRNLVLASGFGYCLSTEDADYIVDSKYNIIPKKQTMKIVFSKIKRFIHKIVDIPIIYFYKKL